MIYRFLSVCFICLLIAACASPSLSVPQSSSDELELNSELYTAYETPVRNDLNFTEQQQTLDPQLPIAELNKSSNDINVSADTLYVVRSSDFNSSLILHDENSSGTINHESPPEADLLESEINNRNDTELAPTPQPLVLEVEELQIQRSLVQEAEIQVQSLGAQTTSLELVQEDRASHHSVGTIDNNVREQTQDSIGLVPESLQDDAYQKQIALLLEAELAFQGGRYSESFDMRMDLARSSGDHRIAQEAYNSASFARDGEAMNQALDLWLKQAPDDQAAHRLRLVQLLQSYQPLQALRSLEQLYFLGAEVDFSMPVSILIYPTEDQVRTMLDAYSQIALKYEERSDIWSAMLLLRIYLANILYLQQLYDQAHAELQTIRSQQQGWQLIPSETLYALDLQEARVNTALLSEREIESWYEQAISRSPGNWQLRLQHLGHTLEPEDKSRVLSIELITQGNSDSLMALHSAARELDLDIIVATIEFYFSESARIGSGQSLQKLAEIAEIDGQLVLADEYLSQLYANPDAKLSAYLSRLHLWLNNDQPDIAREIHRSSWQDHQLNRVEAGIIYARALNEHKLYDQSLRLLTILLQQSDEHNQILLLLVRAETYMFRGDYALMEADLRKVIADAPQESSAYNTLGYVLADINVRLDESERLIDQALHLEPENASYVDSLGWLSFRRGDLERARQLIEWAYSRWQYPDIIAHLGEIYWSLGEPERALYLWLDALENDGATDLLTSTITRLTSAEEGADLYQHLVARLQAITSEGRR